MASTTDPHVPLPSLSDALAPIGVALDGLNPSQRLWWMRGLSGGELRALWRLAEAQSAPLSIDALVGAPDAVVIHEGKNSLPFFCEFQKRFLRRADGSVQGYNHNSGLVTAFAGPGHYTARQHDAHEVWIDYTQLPADAPAVFPALIDNDGGTRRLVFGGMVDRLRAVSAHCTIGLATRHGRPMASWFMLTRIEAAGA